MTHWHDLLDTHGPAVWRTVYRTLGTAEGADDCFQDTFLEFMRLPQTTEIRDPLAMLKRIAVRRAIDTIRRRRTDRHRHAPLTDDRPSSTPDPADTAAANDLLDRLRQLLADLDPQQSTAFVLTQLESLSPAAAAAAMDVTPNHLAVLLHRARTTLRARLFAAVPSSRS